MVVLFLECGYLNFSIMDIVCVLASLSGPYLACGTATGS
jgi:hypothetical protein